MKDLNLRGSQGIFSRNEGSRIAYYRINSPAGCDFWDDHWSENTSENPEESYDPYVCGYLGRGQLRRILLKYLPPDRLILDGGCGMARYVVALRARGYNCFGVDFASKTVERVKSCLPSLPINVGDICHLNLNKESLDAYISLGVMEHFEGGPDSALKEASRVLKKNGVLIVSVPQAFRWRRLNSNPESTPLPDNASFYQYAFTPGEFKAILTKSGFKVEAESGYASHYALSLRFKFFKNLLSQFPRLAHIDLLMDRTPLGRNLSRMLLYAARRSI